MIVRTGLGGEVAVDPTACNQQRSYDATINAFKPGLESALRSYGWTPVFTDVRSSGGNMAVFGCPDLWGHTLWVTLAELPSWEGKDLVVGMIDGSTGPIPSPKALARAFIFAAKGTLPIPLAENYGTGRGGGAVTDSDYYWSTVQRQLAAEPTRTTTAQPAAAVQPNQVVFPARTTASNQSRTTSGTRATEITPDDTSMVRPGEETGSKPWYESLMSGNTLLLAGAAVAAFLIFSKGGK